MPSTHPIDLSLYLVLDPVLCGGEDGMIETVRGRRHRRTVTGPGLEKAAAR